MGKLSRHCRGAITHLNAPTLSSGSHMEIVTSVETISHIVGILCLLNKYIPVLVGLFGL